MNPDRLGAVIASGIGGVTTLLDQYDVLKEKGVRRVSPHTVPMLMPNSPAANVGIELVPAPACTPRSRPAPRARRPSGTRSR
ncbi:hypothetical protein LT493_09355 [Streptomyces tricolor]|nr:hypothetical protein [Streptomyces tricolor]